MKIEFCWSPIIGLARTLLAIGTLLTISFNPMDILIGTEIINDFTSWQKLNIYYLLRDKLLIAKLFSMIILLFVISGYFPCITGLLHWYITYSLFSSCNIIDGGDHVSSILTLLLVPITLTDSRRNHWKNGIYENETFKALTAKIFFSLIKIQICAVYFHAFVGKIPVDEWLNGTATYYWLTHEYFGINEVFKSIYMFLLSSPFIVTIVTWGAIIFEFSLSAAIFIDNNRTKLFLFFIGIIFHFFILINHGLFSFFFAMSSALVLYLLPKESDLSTFKRIVQNVRRINLNFNI